MMYDYKDNIHASLRQLIVSNWLASIELIPELTIYEDDDMMMISAHFLDSHAMPPTIITHELFVILAERLWRKA